MQSEDDILLAGEEIALPELNYFAVAGTAFPSDSSPTDYDGGIGDPRPIPPCS